MPKDRSLPDTSKAYGRPSWLRQYVRFRLGWDPIFPLARREIVLRQQPVVDIGCGLGLLGISMRAAGLPYRYRGIDLVPWKVNKARDVVRHYGFEDIGFDVADALATQIPPGATVFMVDVIQQLDSTSQTAMLGRLADAAEAGSLVILRTALSGHGLRSFASLLKELRISIKTGTRKGVVNFPTREQLEQFFAARRLKLTIGPFWGRTPFATHLVRIESPSRGKA